MSEKQPQDDGARHEDLLETAEMLVWSLLDEQITDAQLAELEQMLAESEAVRERYVDCVQLHVELQDYHAVDHKADESGEKPRIPVLGNLFPEGSPGAFPTPRP
ncbi:MAG: hypothetical protein KDA44_09760 [Planctomycetales bacterium]|nr:hypothetical protein [Planctomycetales bacterium]